MRKYGLLFITIALIGILLLAGCSSSSTTTSPASTTQTTTSQVTTTQATTTSTQATTSSTTTGTETPVSGGVLKITTDQGPTGSLGNPDKMGGSQLYMELCIEPLVFVDGQGTAQPRLAKSWSWSPDNLTLTMQLQQGVKFQDGSDFNADVAVWNLQMRIKDQGLGVSNMVSVSKVDDYTIQIVTNHFDNTWFSNLRGTLGMMISEQEWNQYGADYVDTHPIGCGPFSFKDYVENDHLDFVRNPNYYGQKPYLDEVDINIIVDDTTAELAFENKEDDVLGNIVGGGSTADQLKAKGYNIVTNPAGLTMSLVPSVSDNSSPLANLKVREAIEYALDKVSLAQAVGKGYYTPIYQEAGLTQKVYDPNFQGRTFDLDKAKQLMQDAGYPNGFEIPLICGTNLAGDELPIIQNMLAQINIKCDIQTVSVNQWIADETNGWNGLLESPQAFTELFGIDVNRYFTVPTQPNWSNGIYWTSAYRTQELNSLCQQYFALPLGDQEVAMGRQIVQWLFNNCTFIPLYQESGILAEQSWVHNYALPISAGPVSFDYWNAWVSPH